MIDFVLYANCSATSARALAAKITELQGSFCKPRGRARGRPGARFVRYGSQYPCQGTSLNSWEAVKLASHKLGALITMEEKGVRIPKLNIWNPWDEVTDYKRVFRKMTRHAASDGPIIVSKGESPPYHAQWYDYSIQWIRKFEEYRVHVFRGEVIRVQRKRRKRGVENDPNIWSENRGWVLVECESPFSWLDHLAKKAIESLGLDFGAVDIVRSKWGGLFVLEVNTGPGITPGGVDKYAEHCIRWDNGTRTTPSCCW